jgi:hypothetical protein
VTDHFATHWVAGHHNAELTELAPGILELRPVVRDGASLEDTLGGSLFHQACATVRFDRNRGHRPRLFVRGLPGAGFAHLPMAVRRPRPLQDIAAVELAPDNGGGPDMPLPSSRPTCRLNLLLRDVTFPILELAPHADEAWARKTGRRLARFLGVPLEDRVRVEAS